MGFAPSVIQSPLRPMPSGALIAYHDWTACLRLRSMMHSNSDYCWRATVQGEKPLFYGLHRGALTFASELKAL